MKKYDTSLAIGRWQLPHNEHYRLIQRALQCAERVVIVIGSSNASRSPVNPFTAQERQEMLEHMLTPDDLARVIFVHQPDFLDSERWNEDLARRVSPYTQSRTALVGYKKDASSAYLGHFPQWDFVDIGTPDGPQLNATDLRASYFESFDAHRLAQHVHPAVLYWLIQWQNTPQYTERSEEHRAIQAYRARYTAPYYLTADAVICHNNHVLLIKRKSVIGRNQWALPGGFMEDQETFLECALRELKEETRIEVTETTLRDCLKKSQVFDHPRRSPRGRLITQAFLFVLDQEETPKVQGADDALHAQWFPIQDIALIETQLFEDHALILDYLIDWA